MKWKNLGPKLTDDNFAAFEHRAGRPVPREIRWFLTTVINGGYPEDEHFVTVKGEGETPVHVMYGINHPDEGYDIERFLPNMACHWEQHAWPIGADDYGCPFLFLLDGPQAGGVGIVPWSEYYYDVRTRNPRMVAKDIHEFGKLLSQESTFVRAHELRTPQGFVKAPKSEWEDALVRYKNALAEWKE